MEYLHFLKELHDSFIDLSKAIVFDKKHRRQLFMIALYGTILELCGGFITLLNGKFYTCIPTIFRSIVEAHVELKNLFLEPTYGYSMEASRNDQWIKVLNEAKKGDNPFLDGFRNWDKLDEELSKNKTELKELKEKGYKPLKVYERFKKANMENEYRSLYNFLSCDAHSNIRALISRHLEFEEGDFKVVYYRDEPLEHHVSYLDTTAGIMVDSSGMIHEIFKTGKENVVKEYGKKLGELRLKLLST